MAKNGDTGYNIITHQPLPYALNKARSSGNFRISSGPEGQGGPIDPAKAPAHSRATGALPRPKNLSNIESSKLHKEQPEFVRNFDRQICSQYYWNEVREIPKEKVLTFNCSSVKHDFINNTQQRKIYAKRDVEGLPAVSNRTKMVAEVSDLKWLEVPKCNPDYRALLVDNPKCFYRGRGAFSGFLDQSHKTGRLNKLFPMRFIPANN